MLLHRPNDAKAAGYLANVVSGALPSTAVVRLAAPSSLLAAAIVALETVRSAADDDGAVLSRLRQTLALTHSGLWAKRVTRLTSPSPSFGQHLRSLWPWGQGFLAYVGPEAWVQQLRAGQAPAQTAGCQLVVGAPAGKDVSPLTSWWSGQAGAAAVVPPLPPIVESTRAAYGNDGVEFVLLHPQLAEPRPAGTRCPVCRVPVRGRACPFCHVVPRALEVGRA